VGIPHIGVSLLIPKDSFSIDNHFAEAGRTEYSGLGLTCNTVLRTQSSGRCLQFGSISVATATEEQRWLGYR
jgi:hypothetical protein